MAEQQIERHDVTRPLITEVMIEVVPHASSAGGLPLTGFMVIATRETSHGRMSTSKKVILDSFLNPSHSDTKKKYDANAHAVAVSEVFGVQSVKLA